MGSCRAQFSAEKMWAETAAKPFLLEHMVSLRTSPPRQAADRLALHKAPEGVMRKLEQLFASGN
jgi:arylsulfatase